MNMVPHLRFLQYQELWVNRLLEDLAVRGSGHTPAKNHGEYYNGAIKWVSLADSKKLDKGYIDQTKFTITEDGIKNSSAVLHPAGSVLLSRDAGVGKSAVMKSDMAVSQHFIVWRTNEGDLDNWFLYYILQIQKREFERIAIGSTIKTIGLPYFKKLRINVPTFFEQQKIATFLSAVDTKIQQLQRKKELLEQYKKGIMQKIFSQEIKFKDEDGNDYPDWEDKRLSDTLKSIPTKPYQILKSDILPEGPFPVIDQGQKDIAGYTHNSPKLFNNGACIVYGDHTTIVKYIDYDFVVGADGTKLLQSETENMKFMFYNILFNNIEPEGYKRHFSILKTITLNIPCLDEQSKIEVILSSIDKKTLIVNNELTAMTDFKKGLLQQMFI